jgi:hypothetical protein
MGKALIALYEAIVFLFLPTDCLFSNKLGRLLFISGCRGNIGLSTFLKDETN